MLSADGKVSHRLPPSILSNHTAVRPTRSGTEAPRCDLQRAGACVRACAPTISFDAVVNAERCAGQKNAALWKYLFMYFIHDRTYFGISCGYTTESKSREKKRGRKIRGVIRAAAPGPCDCVESVNPIGSGALGFGNPSVLRLEQVLTERESGGVEESRPRSAADAETKTFPRDSR